MIIPRLQFVQIPISWILPRFDFGSDSKDDPSIWSGPNPKILDLAELPRITPRFEVVQRQDLRFASEPLSFSSPSHIINFWNTKSETTSRHLNSTVTTAAVCCSSGLSFEDWKSHGINSALPSNDFWFRSHSSWIWNLIATWTPLRIATWENHFGHHCFPLLADLFYVSWESYHWRTVFVPVRDDLTIAQVAKTKWFWWSNKGYTRISKVVPKVAKSHL